MLLTPRMVFTSGSSFLIAFTAFRRLDAGGAVVFLTGRDGQRQRVENQVHRPNAVLVHRQIEDALGDGQLLLAVSAMPSSSMVSAMTAAP